MSRIDRRRRGAGMAWLVADRAHGDYLCYWYAGKTGDDLVERARAATASDAVAWGRLRTDRVRIRTGDAHTHWAGTGPRPAGFADTWPGPDGAPVRSETGKTQVDATTAEESVHFLGVGDRQTTNEHSSGRQP